MSGNFLLDIVILEEEGGFSLVFGIIESKRGLSRDWLLRGLSVELGGIRLVVCFFEVCLYCFFFW